MRDGEGAQTLVQPGALWSSNVFMVKFTNILRMGLYGTVRPTHSLMLILCPELTRSGTDWALLFFHNTRFDQGILAN